MRRSRPSWATTSSLNESVTDRAASPSARFCDCEANRRNCCTQPSRIGFVGDMIVGRLCGRRAHDPTSLAIAMLYNPWLDEPIRTCWRDSAWRMRNCPACLPATTAAGASARAVAERSGLPAGIPVSPAVHDQYAASLGAASVAEGDVNFGAGTAWVILANAAEHSPPATPDVFVCSHPVNGLFGQMLSLINGGSAIQWAMSLFGHRHAEVQTVDRMLDAAVAARTACDFGRSCRPDRVSTDRSG